MRSSFTSRASYLQRLTLLGVLRLIVQMARLVKGGTVQFIIATHSPILLTFPGAIILSFVSGQLKPTTLEETAHYHRAD